MLKIRLSRTGKRTQPNFRVVLQEKTYSVKGKFIEKLGFYRPTANPKEFSVDLERIKHWLSVGAQPSDAIATLLKQEGVEGMDKFMAPRTGQKKKKKEEAPKEKAPAEAEKAEEAPKEEAKAEEVKTEEVVAEEPKEEEPKK